MNISPPWLGYDLNAAGDLLVHHHAYADLNRIEAILERRGLPPAVSCLDDHKGAFSWFGWIVLLHSESSP